MATAFYLVRHGEAQWSIASERKLKGWGNDLVPLTAEGIRQIEYLGTRLCHEACQVIISSPMTRCLHSAAILTRMLDLPLYVEFDLHEWVSDTSFDWEFDFAAVEAAMEERDRLDGEWPESETRRWEPLSRLRRRVGQVLSRYTQFQRVLVVSHEEAIYSLTGERLRVGEMLQYPGSRLTGV
jgi:broad specificity phosphatase PhoE